MKYKVMQLTDELLEDLIQEGLDHYLIDAIVGDWVYDDDENEIVASESVVQGWFIQDNEKSGKNTTVWNTLNTLNRSPDKISLDEGDFTKLSEKGIKNAKKNGLINYLTGATAGDWVYDDNGLYVSLNCVESWLSTTKEAKRCNELQAIIGRLKALNGKALGLLHGSIVFEIK